MVRADVKCLRDRSSFHDRLLHLLASVQRSRAGELAPLRRDVVERRPVERGELDELSEGLLLCVRELSEALGD